MKRFDVKKIMAFAVVAGLMLLALVGCSKEVSYDKLLGNWEFYGVIENSDGNYNENNYSMKDSLVGEDYLEASGLKKMPDNKLVLTVDGVREMYEKVPGTELDSVKMNSEDQMVQRIKITEMDGKKLDEPIYEDTTFTLVDGYLFVQNTFTDEKYNGGNVNIYKLEESK